ncbi:MAG: hypothetical protein JW929_13205 [Anaerolineales bacterium]|nr:hypothetical protein [Anaerolineales bacterium]
MPQIPAVRIDGVDGRIIQIEKRIFEPPGSERGTAGSGRIIGVSFDRGKVSPLEESLLLPLGNALRVPLPASGKPRGSIQVVWKDGEWTAREIEVVGAVAGELAQRLDAARLPGAGERRDPQHPAA